LSTAEIEELRVDYDEIVHEFFQSTVGDKSSVMFLMAQILLLSFSFNLGANLILGGGLHGSGNTVP